MAPNRAGLPENPDVAKAVIEAQLKDKGLIGRLIGNKDNAPFNIAFVAMFLVAVLMATAMAMPVQDRSVILPALMSTFTAIIGFLFGKGK